MTKNDYILSLYERLLHLPQDELEERFRFYSEMIDDRMEEGVPEEEAVAAIGTVEEIAAQIAADIFPVNPQKVKAQKQRTAGEIILLVLGSPVWVPLLIAAFTVGLALYISLWSVIVSLWAVFGSVVACGVAGIVAGVDFALNGYASSGLALLGVSVVCLGLAIFLFLGCKAASDGTILLTKKLFVRPKKEEAK
jgi:uncharacterized membrane protein